jgi:cytochrome c oxidase cbb3-type subunit 3
MTGQHFCFVCFLVMLPHLITGQEGRTNFDRDQGLADKNPYTSPEDLKLGRQYFLGHCGQCHGPEGEGGRGINLTTGRLRHGSSDRELYLTLRKGLPGSEMPGSRLSQVELWRIVTYIRKLGAAGANETATGDAKAGTIIFEGKGGCVACHVVNGKGGQLGPALTDIGVKRSLKFLRQSLIDPDVHIDAEYRSITVALRSGTKVKGIVLNEDDYSIQLREMNGDLRAFLKSNLTDVQHDSKSLMPSYKSALSEKELNDVVAYLNSLRGNE